MVSSLFLRTVAAVSLLQPALGAYVLQDDFSGASFFDNFDFFTAADPTNGFVKYVDQATAQSAGLISAADGSAAYFGVDSTTTLQTNGTGRESVRITSKNSYTHALIISDIVHMPGGICGTWPAHWTLGPNWPTNGEIDIIEGVNNAADNLMSLHTTPSCTIAGANETGTLQTNDCQTGEYNIGCGVTADTSASYGSGFNGGLGGVYATQWTSAYIRIWFFPRGSIPSDITAGSPDPTGWGLPQANFQGSCDIDAHFASHQIIFDTTFCGDYGNANWASNTQCNSLATTCPSYVAANPSAFQNAYWSVNSVKVYQNTNPVSTATVATPTSSATPVSSVLAPGMGNSTAATGTATSTLSSVYSAATLPAATASATAPAFVSSYEYVGCASSTDAFATFTQIENNAAMTLEKCISDCSGYTYAGVFNTLCFCANTLGSTTVSSSNVCNNACPGNLNELCGGSKTVSRSVKAARQASNNILLSLYESTGASLVSVTPASQTFAYGMGITNAPAATHVVLSTTYIDICTKCEGGYTTQGYTTTILRCGCVANEVSTISMQAIETTSCDSNGNTATVTVTLPAAIAAASGTSPASATLASASAVTTETIAVTQTLANGAVTTSTVAAVVGANGVAVVGTGTGAYVAKTATATYAAYTGGAVAGKGAVGGSVVALVAAGGAALAML